jgi:hypothetical protein
VIKIATVGRNRMFQQLLEAHDLRLQIPSTA